MDTITNFSYSLVATAPSPVTSGTSLVVAAGDGALFAATPVNAVVWPLGQSPLVSKPEIVRITARSTDTLTIVRAQEGTTARRIKIGDQIAIIPTALTWAAIQAMLGGAFGTSIFSLASGDQFRIEDSGGYGAVTMRAPGDTGPRLGFFVSSGFGHVGALAFSDGAGGPVTILSGGTTSPDLNLSGGNLAASILRPTVAVTADRTFQLGDAGKFVRVTATTLKTQTIPNNSSVAFPLYVELPVVMGGTGSVAVAAASGVTIEVPPGYSLTLTKQNSMMVLRKRGTNTWAVIAHTDPHPAGADVPLADAGGYFGASPTAESALQDVGDTVDVSALPDATDLTGAEILPGLQSGDAVGITVDQIRQNPAQLAVWNGRFRAYTDFNNFVATVATNAAQLGAEPVVVYRGGTGAQVTQAWIAQYTFGIAGLNTGTTTTGYCGVAFNAIPLLFINGGGPYHMSAYVGIPLDSDGTNTFSCQVGMFSNSGSITGYPTDGLFFYADKHSTGNWQAVVLGAGTPTSVDTGVSCSGGTHLLTVDYDGTTARFYVDGVLKASITAATATFPVDDVFLLPASLITKTAGTTSRNLYVDLMYLEVGDPRPLTGI